MLKTFNMGMGFVVILPKEPYIGKIVGEITEENSIIYKGMEIK